MDSEIRRRGLSIERHPTMDHQTLARFYRSLTVLLYPSRRESLGLTAIECLACGTPVVAQAIPGPGSYIVSGENGALVPLGDTGAMRDAVLSISALSQADRRALSRRCSASVAHFNSDVVSADMLSFLDRVTSSDRTPSIRRGGAEEPSTAVIEQQLAALLCDRVSDAERAAVVASITDGGQSLARYAGDRRVLQLLAGPLATLVRRGDSCEALHDLARLLRKRIAVRNVELLDEYDQLTRVLACAGVPLVPLKGVAALIDRTYLTAGDRIVNDIDVRIPPMALRHALTALAAAGYQQACNRFERQPRDAEPFGALNVNDFRNDPRFVDTHVPRVLRPGALFSIELHIHVTNRHSPLCRLLDQHVEDEPASLFHLLHNFEHSHRKDGYGALGLIDWQHLADADRRLRAGDAEGLAAQLMEMAREAGVAGAMAVHLWQLDAYFRTPGVCTAADRATHGAAIRQFERLHRSRGRQWLARRALLLRRVSRGFVSRRVREERFGPVPLHAQLHRTWRFYRGEIGR